VDYLWPFIKNDYDTPEAPWRPSRALPDPMRVTRTIDHDVSHLTPMVTFGYRPDNVKPAADMADTPVDQVYIGSCTNGRISDLRIAARVLTGKPSAARCGPSSHRPRPRYTVRPWRRG
jgi:3-isopropylmalate/(R)-2-methylmalate dehydratase large subunit